MLQPIWLTSVYNNTYWNIGTVPVACVEIGMTVCATFEILLAGPFPREIFRPLLAR